MRDEIVMETRYGRRQGMETNGMHSNARTTMQTGGVPPHNNNQLERTKSGHTAWLQRIRKAYEADKTDEWQVEGDDGAAGTKAKIRGVWRNRMQMLMRGNRKGGGGGCEWRVAVARMQSRTTMSKTAGRARASRCPPTTALCLGLPTELHV